MKRIVLTATAAAIYLVSSAQEVSTASNDSLQHDLQEVVIEAPKVIRKSDMDVYYPSSSAVEYSKNGLQLLRNLMIPALSVNEMMKTVKTGGESVQVRINDRQATLDQVNNLRPETIKRVEWIDDPGLRYGGAVAVVNFVVVNPTIGGSLMVDALQALNAAWGPYNAYVQLNHGRSQWGLSAQYKETNRLGAHRDYSETFTFANGETLTRNETPRDGYASDDHGLYQLDYSYVIPDTTLIWVALSGEKSWHNGSLYNGIMSQSNGGNNILLHDYTDEKGFTPSISAYFEQHFAHNQILAVDMEVDFLQGRSLRSYTEHDELTSALLNDVNTNIKDRNQSYSVASNYIKNWNASRFTAGVSYTANRNRSTYQNLGGEIYHQRQDKTYFYGEYFQRLNKVSLTAGMGAQYTDFKFRETQQGSNSWSLRPRFTANYRYSPVSMFTLNFTSWQTTPSLTQTNITSLQTDGIQWQVGNPNLKTASSYQLTLRYKYTLDRFSGFFQVR
jgi:outer membrane receptor protein involved in Fe transport